MTRIRRALVSPRLFAAVAVLCLLLGPAPALADAVVTSMSDGFGRALFTLSPPAKPAASVKDGVLTIGFPRKVGIDAKDIAHGLAPYISSARMDADGKTFRFALNQPVRLHSSVSAGKVAIDLVPASFAGTPPDLPPPPPPPPTAVDVSKLPELGVRAGAYSTFTRLVFDWHARVPYAVFPGAGRITIRFEAKARPDFAGLEHVAPPWVKQAGWRIENGGTVIDFNTETESGYHDFRDGTHIVLDILAPKTDAAAYTPPSDGKASVPRPSVVTKTDLKADPRISAAQINAVAKAAEAVNGKPAAPTPALAPVQKPNAQAPKTAETKTDAAPPEATTDAKAVAANAAPPAPPAEQAQAHLTHEGAVLSFPGAGGRGVAAFTRGLTAWIVLDDARPIDAAYLKSALGDFPASVDVQNGGGVSVLRIGLKRPEQIAAHAEGSLLKIVLAPKTDRQATGIELARDDDDPKNASLVSLLPRAAHAVPLVDPVAGDTLIVVPGAAGRAMLEPRRYVDFAALPTAAGLAFTPFVDDLDIGVHQTRLRIARPGGLTLTAPQMPPADSPAALARNGDGPCYLNFEAWNHPVKGSFLAQQRMLRDNAARLPADKANAARLTEARFYIANGFGAEALGLVNLMQATDPSLQDDKQLQTIKAAADIMMARYRDAYNALSGSAFDNDRHAALWRGLAASGLEDWGTARASLLKAMPVLKRYPADLQARAQIALANAAIATGALEAADAALGHLPKDMPKPLMLDAELARAKLYAGEGRYRDAHMLFVALQKTGDPRTVAHAIYEDVVDGLAAGAVTPNDAIARLEKLRYRWRGDSLELNTLRRLGALYFGQKRWRDGLEILRIAARSFPNDDYARQAQDDMRKAFSGLFLKGKADKMPPVESLALFYDFIDLTPIGADGDEMIRRMADRLVKVDLLGPAEALLQYQVDKRLNGVARAQVAAKLAMIDLMDHKAKDALAVLRSTRVAGTPDTVTHERILLEARALAALKQWDQALDIIAVDDAPDTRRLRADIYWESGNWAVAAQKAEELLGDSWSSPEPLSVAARQEVMRAAIAYSLANDEAGLERLRDHFAAKMKASPDASAFAVVTQRIDTQGLAFRDIAGRIASIDTLETFMADFRKRYDGAAATN